ncbi:MAG: Na/Pi cotransporter family protein [Lachnospiraceae bacterium]|nr:Na/Pi cotransporter family protein [Lachnospiraceae bacterium]
MTFKEVFSLLGGVSLFLLGMTMMSSGLRNACGNKLQGILEKATKNKITAVLTGIAITILIQSSSATDVMVIGFVNAGMLNLGQAIGVIMGANIGTTVTAQITAFDIGAFAPLLLFAGVIMYLFVKKSIVKYIGEILMGFGMLFVGISIMKTAIAPLAATEGFKDVIAALDNPVLAVLFGIAFTALLQSSSSSIVITQTFAIEGILAYSTAVYIIIGAAVGSVMPNILASLTTNRNGKRTAVLNLLFNCFRAVIIIALINLIPQILDLIQSLSPGDVGRQIANTHTIFAIAAVLILLPFTKQIIALSKKIIPVREDESRTAEERSVKYMLNLSKMAPALAVEQAHREIERMGHISFENFRNSLDCFFSRSLSGADDVREREESVDILSRKITDAMGELRALELDPAMLKKVSAMTICITDIERISDHAENIIEFTEELTSTKAQFSDKAIEELKHMADTVLREMDLALEIFGKEDYSKLGELQALENEVDGLEEELVHNHTNRFMQSECEPMAGVIFTELVTELERCADHSVNIAYTLNETLS